jgi:hypothetical protein
MNLVERAKNMIVSPKTEWNAVAAEEPNIQQILIGYVLPLALIPTLATIVGWGAIGILGFTSFTYGIAMGLVQLINAFLSVLIAGFVIDALAGSFGSTKNMGRAVQLVAYSMTPIWVFGILNIIPAIGWLSFLLGLYSLYLIYLGLTPLMKTPEDKKAVYLIVSIVILIAVYWIISIILTSILLAIFGLSLFGAMMSY